jgi:peptidylprolyl isomerase
MNRNLRSPIVFTLVFGVVAVVASACESTLEVNCDAVANVTASTSGDTTITSSGLRYRELTVGTGTQVATQEDCQFVRTTYVGRLLNGTQFDASPPGGTLDFYVGGGSLIPGFEQGMVGMRVGGRRQLIIPPALGYGNQEKRNAAGQVVIPANSTLVFDVELFTVSGN